MEECVYKAREALKATGENLEESLWLWGLERKGGKESFGWWWSSRREKVINFWVVAMGTNR